MAEGPSAKPHAVVLPLPGAQGHLNPFMLLSRMLVSRGFTITFVVSERTLKDRQQQQQQSHDIRFVGVPDQPPGSLESKYGSPTPAFQASLEIVHGMRAGFECLLQKLAHEVPPVTCFIADILIQWSHEAAVKCNIPRFLFFTTNAHFLTVIRHAASLVSQGVLPFKDNGSGDGPGDFIDSIPGLPPMYAIDFPMSVRTRVEYILSLAEHLPEAAGILVNTFYEIESRPLDAIPKNPPVYPVGPLLLLCGDTASDARLASHWQEEKNCLQWLDTRAPSSVLYVSFGSMASMTPGQMKELAHGLADSQQAFLWVIRPNSVDGTVSDVLPDVLPEGFTERTIDRGRIITWAPQLQVLSHPSVGGFLTHCGWNSVTENFSVGGVPMMCWPLFGEQRLNCRLLVDEWKVGIEVRQGEDGMVSKGEVERMVRSLMQGEEGSKMRRRAVEVKDMARRAVEEGGSSYMYLEAFVRLHT